MKANIHYQAAFTPSEVKRPNEQDDQSERRLPGTSGRNGKFTTHVRSKSPKPLAIRTKKEKK